MSHLDDCWQCPNEQMRSIFFLFFAILLRCSHGQNGALSPTSESAPGATRIVINEDEYIFITIKAPTTIDYLVRVLQGPNVDVFLMSEVG